MSWFTRFLGLDNAVESTVKKTLQESFPFLPGTPANGTLDYPLCRPDADGFLPVGFYRNRSKQGDNPQAYLHDEDLRRAREQSRDLACSNEYARNGLVNRRNYIVGTGFKVTAESVSDDTANDALVQQVNDWLARYAAITKRCEKEKESVMRGDRDGECFLRLFKEDGLLQWRFVEPEHVGNFDGQTPFGIKTDPKDITKVIHYLVRYEDGGPVEEVPADEMIHVKLNTDSGIKRGLPFLYPVFGILRKIESTNMNMATNVAIMASIAMIRRRQFELQTTVDTSNSTAADVQTSNPFNRGSSVDNYRVFRPGTILDVDGQTEYEFPANQINLGGVVEVKQSLLQTAAAGMGLPEYMLTSDASNGNFASTQVAETPAIAGFLAMQHLWADVFGCGPYVDGADNGLTWRAIEFAVEGGVLPPNVLTDIRLNTEGPSIEVRDKAAETQRNQSLADAGIISRDKWAKKEGEHKAHKSDEEMQQAKDKEQQASQQHELAMAGAKGKGLKEGWEEDLHPRADDGKFASKGSEGGEGENDKKEPWEMTKDEYTQHPDPLDAEEDIDDIADSLRQAMEKAVGNPKDQCIACAYALKREFPDAEIWQGYVSGEPHTLAKLGGKFVDVTADQFGRHDSVQVLDPEDMPSEYKRFVREHPEIEFSKKSHWETEDAIHKELKGALMDAAKANMHTRHKNAVVYAVSHKKNVPSFVKADYPELTAKPDKESAKLHESADA